MSIGSSIVCNEYGWDVLFWALMTFSFGQACLVDGNATSTCL